LAVFYALRDKAPSAPFPLPEDTVITPRARFFVSFAAALPVALALAGCAGSHSRPAPAGFAPTDEPPLAIRFDNTAHDYVHVYLVGEKREWFLGRVEIGARATLRIPQDVLADTGPMRLAVLEGQPRTLQVAGDSRAATSLRQPIGAILSHRWTFSETTANRLLTSFPRDPLPR
jgi:hypothetical protein